MDFTARLTRAIDTKTKPLGSLGALEALAMQIGQLQGTTSPTLEKPTIIVFAGDHGIATEGVSAYPQEVTHQMVMNFLHGGAAINVFAAQHGIDLQVVDAGVNHTFEADHRLIDNKVAYGTASYLRGEAMTEQQLRACLNAGGDVVDGVVGGGCNVVGFGEMGIGNTSSASMLMSYLCDLPVRSCVGRGTGLGDEQLERKVAVLERVRAFHGVIDEPLKVLQTFGGFEIAQMCGAFLRAAESGVIVLVDGFIATSAFLVASEINPSIMRHAIFCHLSDEAGHRLLLDYLNAEPLLRLGMRLGEGSGCAVAYPIIESAVAFLNDMASFDSASVTDAQ